MNLQEMHDAHTHRGGIHADDVRFGLQAMKWYGWGSPVGLGIGFGSLLFSAGGFLLLLHLAGLLG